MRVDDSPRRRVPDLLVEQLALDELSAEKARAVQAELGDGAEARLEQIAASNRSILGEIDPSSVAREVARRADISATERRQRTRRQWFMLAPTLAAATVLLLWIVKRPDTDTLDQAPPATAPLPSIDPASGVESTRSKGLAPHLMVARKRGDTVERLDDGAIAREGDVLQLGYVAAGREHGLIFSLDGRGVVTLHYPQTRGASTELKDDGEVALSFAYQLDDAPMFERFVFVTVSPEAPAGTRLDVSTVLSAAEALGRDVAARERGALSVPAFFEQSSVLLRKRAP